jgi:hypothetical protein
MPEQVRKFLLDFKEVAVTSGVYLVPRHDTQETMRYLGLTKRNVKEILIGLSVADYCAGPKADRDRAGEIWEFGKDVDGCDVYIKLKLAEVDGKLIAKCISFHIPKFPLRYPHR